MDERELRQLERIAEKLDEAAVKWLAAAESLQKYADYLAKVAQRLLAGIDQAKKDERRSVPHDGC